MACMIAGLNLAYLLFNSFSNRKNCKLYNLFICLFKIFARIGVLVFVCVWVYVVPKSQFSYKPLGDFYFCLHFEFYFILFYF